MTPKQICFSTAIWDPKWFHDFMTQDVKFIKDGKICGLRMPIFNSRNHECRGMPCQYLPKSCNFLKSYALQLSELDFNEIKSTLVEAATLAAKELHIDDPDVVLLVHEAPDNPCSERSVIMKWFEKNGVKIKEWQKPSENNKK